MSRIKLEQRVAELEKQMGALLANHTGAGRLKDWRRTRGAFTGDSVMAKVFAEGRKLRAADRKRAQRRSAKKSQARS